MCCLKYEQDAYEDAVKRMPKAESFVQTPDGPGNVKSIDLLRETVKVSLDSSPEPLKKYHNCEVRVLRNGKGSREGIEIPERTARYVEEVEEPVFAAAPVIASSVPYEVDEEMEEAPVREKMGQEGGKSRRRHRGGRRRGGKGEGAAAQPKTEQLKTEGGEKKGGKPRPESGEKKGGKAQNGKQPKVKTEQPKPKAEHKAAVGEDGAPKRRRPHHRGRRHRGGKGGEGGAPKSE